MTDRAVTIDGKQYDVRMARSGTTVRAGDMEIEMVSLRDGEAEVRIAGRTYVIPYTVAGSVVSLAFDGDIYIAQVADSDARVRTRHRDHSMSAPMPGLVLKIFVKAGDVVAKATPLLVLEAMKMEHQISAPYDGTVAAVNCREGEMVQAGTELIELSENP